MPLQAVRPPGQGHRGGRGPRRPPAADVRGAGAPARERRRRGRGRGAPLGARQAQVAPRRLLLPRPADPRSAEQDRRGPCGIQCARVRPFRRELFCRASRTRRERSIRPKISRIDFDATVLERSEVWRGPPKPAVGHNTGRGARGPRGPREPRAGTPRPRPVAPRRPPRLAPPAGRGHVPAGPRAAGDARFCSSSWTFKACCTSFSVATCVDSNHWFGGSPPNFRSLYLDHIEVDSADFWTNRSLSSSFRSTAEEYDAIRSMTRTLKSG